MASAAHQQTDRLDITTVFAVLVVEDDPVAQQAVMSAFAGEDQFFLVALVKTAAAALAVAEAEHVDVVVLDDRLHGERRGISIVDELRLKQDHVGIILWSAYPEAADHPRIDARVAKSEPLELVAAARRLVA